MGLPWVRFDTAWARNPKVMDLAYRKCWQSLVVYCAGLGYSGEQGLDGFIPESALPFIHGTPKQAQDLVAASLWIPTPGGWDINDWREYQPSTAETEARSQRAKAAAETRWAKARASNVRAIGGRA